jgi:hypothetical protein
MFAKSLVTITNVLGLLMPMAGASAQTLAPPPPCPIAQAAHAVEGVDPPSRVSAADATPKRQRDPAAAHHGRRGDVTEGRKAFDIWPEAGFYDK